MFRLGKSNYLTAGTVATSKSGTLVRMRSTWRTESFAARTHIAQAYGFQIDGMICGSNVGRGIAQHSSFIYALSNLTLTHSNAFVGCCMRAF